MSFESVMSSIHLILCPLLFLPATFHSIRIFSSESILCIRWPKYWSFSFSVNPSNEYSGLISFRLDWFDLLAVQGILRSLLQPHSLKASILWHSAFFMVQLKWVFTYATNYSYVIICKSMCLMHSEAKQTETSEFGAEKCLLQGQARRMGSLCSKCPKLPEGF